nr:hypothetical protein [Microvirga guangxiensis]
MSAIERIAALIPPHLERGFLLSALHLVPERIVNDAQVRNVCPLPALRRVRPRHPFAGPRILHIGAAVPDQLANIEFIVENAGPALLLATDGGVLPRAVLGTGYMLLVQPAGDGARAHAMGE